MSCMSRRRRRRRDEQLRLIREWRASGDSAEAFAARIGVASATLYRWRAAAAGVTSGPAEPALSQIVEVRTAAVAAADTRLEIEAGGRRVLVPASFDEASLRRLLRVLEATT